MTKRNRLALATGLRPLGSAVTPKSRMDWYFSSALALDLGVLDLEPWRFVGVLAVFLAGMAILWKHSSGGAFPFRVSRKSAHGPTKIRRQEDQGACAWQSQSQSRHGPRPSQARQFQ